VNELLAHRYDEVVHRLAVGIEPRDALRDGRAGGSVHVTLESPSELLGARPLAHAGGRWSIRYVPKLPAHVDLRIDDPSRRFVPRRLRVPIVSLGKVITAESGDGAIPATQRTWRPVLFPGAAYPLVSSATGIRGRALQGGRPARWARIEATLPDSTEVLWRAHGDDRGEFLLTVGPDPAGLAELPDIMAIRVTAFGRNPAPSEPEGGTTDGLWDMQIETVAPPAAPATDDPVSLGVTLPQDYDPGFNVTHDIDLVPGRIRSDVVAFVLV
jgi:hypothetical protein